MRLAEELADYFAASFLMPKRLIKRAWGDGLQDIPSLARHFNVSAKAMRWRIDELCLDEVETETRRFARHRQLMARNERTRHEYPLAY